MAVNTADGNMFVRFTEETDNMTHFSVKGTELTYTVGQTPR